jgi:hypothetical protein
MMRDPLGRDRFLRRGVDFHPVASGEQKRLGATGRFAQDAIDFRMAGKAFARLDIRGVMTEADAEKIHHIEWV